jgi:GNAT superfamily N-acetyltransferase
VHLRPARAADAATVAAIWEQGWRDGHPGHVPDALVAVRTPESFRTRAGERVADTTVAEVDGEVAGFVMVVGDEVEQVYLPVVHRGGIAALLPAEAERLVASGGHQLAWLAVVPGNTRARRFYQRCGWVDDDGPFDYPATHNGETIHVHCHRYIKAVYLRFRTTRPRMVSLTSQLTLRFTAP